MKTKKSLLLRLTGVALALALVGAACGGGDSDNESTTDAGSQESTEDSSMNGEEMATGIDTGSAKLRQTLTDLLNSHVYLAGIAVEQAVLTEDPTSPQFKAAATTLDQNSQDLAGAAAEALGMHVDSLVTAVDSLIGGDGKGFDLLYTASKEHMPMTASALAGAIVAQNPDQFSE